MRKLTWFNTTALTLGFAFLYLPMVILVVYSFNASKLVTVWGGFSTRWYGELMRNEAFLDAAREANEEIEADDSTARLRLRGILARNLDVNREDVHLLATLEGPGFAARTLRRLTADDLVIALATPRYFADTVRLAEIARKHGAAVLALTDGPHSPLVATATLALYAQTDCHYFAASDASLTALVEALASAFAHATVDLVPAATRVTEAVLPWLDRDYAAWPPQGGADDLPDTPPPGTVP